MRRGEQAGGEAAGWRDVETVPASQSQDPVQDAQPASPQRGMTMGRYELRGELGRGGMGVVFRVWDPELRREVALKVLLQGMHSTPAAHRRFLREARAGARLEHPNLVPVYDIGEHEGALFYTMPCVEGPPLSVLLREGPIPPPRAARWTMDLARTLHYAHVQGLVHRDVKPGNILIEGGERPMLADFGLAQWLEPEESTASLDSQLVGTPSYLAPELIREGVSQVGPKTDQYALGVVFYEMLTATRPFRASTPAGVLKRVLEHDPPTPPRDRVPPALAAICARAMAKHPADRYPDVASLAEDLERFLGDEPVLAYPRSWPGRLGALTRRRRRELALVGLALAAGVSLAGLGALSQRLRERSSQEAREREAETRREAMERRVAELLAEGRVDEADTVFLAYAAFEDNAETRALAGAWAGQAKRLAARGEAVEAQDAWANAYALAREPEVQGEALLALATGARAREDWEGLAAALSALAGRAPGSDSVPAARELRRDLALAERDLVAARDLSADPDEATLLVKLANTHPTEHRADYAFAWDMDQDGTPELGLRRDGEPRLLLVDATSPDLPFRAWLSGDLTGQLTALHPLQTLAPTPPTLVVGESPWPVLMLVDGALQEVLRLGVHVDAAVAADLDGDDTPEGYASGMGTLLRLDLDGAPRVRPAHGPSNRTNTALGSLVAADLDGDGMDELAAGAVEWGGYDVRVYRQGAHDLELVARRRLGKAYSVRVVETARGPRLAALQVHEPEAPLNYVLFRRDEPQGEPAGVHVLRLGPAGLEREALLPLPKGRPEERRRRYPLPMVGSHLLTGDLSGDGLSEIVLQRAGADATLYLQRADGGYAALPLPDTAVRALAQVDDDPEEELIVELAGTDGRLWVLGAGSERPPLQELAAPVPWPVPAGVSASLTASWARAEDLAALGRDRAAAGRFLTLAALGAGTPDEGAARRRAAELLERAGDRARAAELYAEVARAPGLASAGWEGVLRAHLANQDPERALKAANARAMLPDPPSGLAALVARLKRWDAAPRATFDFSEGLDGRWRVLAPFGVSLEPGRGLHLSASAGAELLELPVTWEGGPLRVSVTFAPSRIDWGSYLAFSLNPRGPYLGVSSGLYFATVGGSDVLTTYARCAQAERGFNAVDQPGALIGRSVRARWQVDPADLGAVCTLEGSEGLDGRQVYKLDSMPLEPGRAVLRVTAPSVYQGVVEGVLQKIELQGLVPLDEPESAADRVNRMLATGHPELALGLLDGQDTASRDDRSLLARALALEAVDRREEATAALKQALARDPELGGELGRLFRSVLDRLETPLRRALGPRYFLSFWEYNQDFLSMHRREAPAMEALTRHLDGLEQEARGEAPEARVARTWLLARRGGAWRQQGRVVIALNDLVLAEELAEALLLEGPEPELAEELGRLLSFTAREIALVHLLRREPQAALDELVAALAHSPAPQVFADALAASPEYDALHALPRWREIEAARALGSAP